MASLTMAASFLATPATSAKSHRRHSSAGGLVVARASRPAEGERVDLNKQEEDGKSSGGRRDLVFAAAAAAACSIAKLAMAEETLKRGSPQARKKYAPICVTMPTARICNY